jgi:energy-coupling factor transporter ATP-binding protein EcfA2
LPFLQRDFELNFDHAITIIVGENGTGKSTLLEGIAVLAGYDEAGGGKGYMPVDHSQVVEAMGGRLSRALRAAAAAVQVWAGTGDGRGYRPLPAHARILGRSEGVHRDDARGMTLHGLTRPLRSLCADCNVAI